MAVVLYTKPHCSLCTGMRAVVEATLGQEGTDWLEVDISQNEELTARLAAEVPLLVIDGTPTFRYFVTERALRRALRERRRDVAHRQAHGTVPPVPDDGARRQGQGT